ncbi:sugar efflux transporter C [Escherichia coli]|uniref:Sugar efflux transporter C n=1 Tax=Escherichia coli TaxID=562 RepID=A0A2X1QAW4_ECOLX|nr:sugar efflux transporter C [Escherichia coli]
MCFYASVLMATTPAVELELQILNAIFLGILCGIGMLYFQDLMPEKIGSRQRYMQILHASAGLSPALLTELWLKSGATMRCSGWR